MSAKATSRARAGIAALLGVIAVGLIAPPAWAGAVARRCRQEGRGTPQDRCGAGEGLHQQGSERRPSRVADRVRAGARQGGGRRPEDRGRRRERAPLPNRPDGDDKAPAKDQKYWAARLKNLQDRLARDQDYADAMQTRINALTTDFVNRDDPAQRAVIEQNRQKSIAELARLTKSVQDTKKAIADLDEEARRAGVPPGWLR